MFDLEKSIAEWRQQMLAAGIQAPAPLDELENHLREEIDRQTKSGVNGPEAFAVATKKVGQPHPLNREFMKTGGLYDFLSRRRNLKITVNLNGLLGLLWLAYFLNRFGRPAPLLGQSTATFLFGHASNGEPLPLLALLMLSVTLIGSGLLIFDSNWGRSLVRSVAMCWLFFWFQNDCLWAPVPGVSVQYCLANDIVPFTFMLVSIFVLHLPETANVKATVKL